MASLARKIFGLSTPMSASRLGIGHAARHLIECQSLASAIHDYGPFETHQAKDRLLEPICRNRRGTIMIGAECSLPFPPAGRSR
jgi:hypothetical protein